MMSLRSHLLLLSAGLLSLGAVAYAQAPAAQADAGAKPMRPPADRAALKSHLEKRFDAADANKDGSLTPQERQAQRGETRAKMREHMFARLDADKNGSVSKAEFAAAPARGPHAAGKDGGGGHRGHMAGGMMRHQLAEYRDKPISRTQFVDAGLGHFDRVDTDHDGKISSAERDAARKAMRDRLAPAHRHSPPPPGL
jgi:Ca2+-binding EF-hand superfamily protein